MTGFPEWTFVDGEFSSARTCMAWQRGGVTTSDITEMVYFVASDTRLVGWCSRVCYALGYTLSRRLGRATGCYIEMTLK